MCKEKERSGSGWTDAQKHLVDMRAKVLGFGAAAGLAFAGWLVGGFDLNLRDRRAEAVVAIGAVTLVAMVWTGCVMVVDRVARGECVRWHGRLQPLGAAASISGTLILISLAAALDNFWLGAPTHRVFGLDLPSRARGMDSLDGVVIAAPLVVYSAFVRACWVWDRRREPCRRV